MVHFPVLLQEFLSFFDKKEIRFFVDGTVGAGGHALALLKAHPEIETFIGIDRDSDTLMLAEQTLQGYKHKVRLVHGNYRFLHSFLPLEQADGIFLDLGVSSMQLDQGEKGFSFTKDGPLDMRMDKNSFPDAKTIINTFSEKNLAQIFWEYGEDPRAKRVAKAIVEARKKQRIETTGALCKILQPVLTWSGRSRKHIHPFTLIFQALRIKVNDEINGLKEGLLQASESLARNGRLGVISFHSLEDRVVKEAFRNFAREKEFQILTKKPLVATDDERRHNPRCRSAKMRFLEKIEV